MWKSLFLMMEPPLLFHIRTKTEKITVYHFSEYIP